MAFEVARGFTGVYFELWNGTRAKKTLLFASTVLISIACHLEALFSQLQDIPSCEESAAVSILFQDAMSAKGLWPQTRLAVKSV